MYYNFNKLYIIESLPDGDLKTGKILYEDLFKWHKENGNSFDAEYLPIKNAEGLNLFFDIITSEYRSTYIRPTLHFETHGNEEGIQLKSGEIYYWNDLLDRLSDINYYSRNYLLLVLALCKGGYVLSAIENHITKRAPFFAAVYSYDIVITEELSRGFYNFYTEIFISRSAKNAMDKLCAEIKNEASHFKLISCAHILKSCFESYLVEHCNRKMVQKRTEGFITKLKHSNNQIDINKIRPFIKKEFKKDNQKVFFNFVRDQFFMIDVFPENKERIKLEFKNLMC